MQLSPGAQLRSFEVLGPLGAGGMGAVYRARDRKLGRDVAIKILQDKLTGSAEHLQRFKREARAASALNHPNIITIFEIDEFEGAPFIAMELVEGTSLREELQKGRLPTRRLLDVATQIADGLTAAHERGIVHRDLKPENVMITLDGRVKIVDFGLARIHAAAGSDESTATAYETDGRIVGTTSYMSPEQASGGVEIDFRSDQFSFGSILYELATARRAFQRNTTMETLAAILRDEPEPVQRINPSLPAPLCWLIDRCLAKDPSQRYASTRDLARELRTIRDRLPEAWPGTPRQLRWPSTRSLVIATIAVAAIISAGAIVQSSRREERPVPPAISAQKYLAVLPFKDEGGRPDGQLFSLGLSEAVRERLGRYPGVRVIDPPFPISSPSDGASFRRIAQELGATLLLTAAVQRSGDDLRVTYSLMDATQGRKFASRTVRGTVQNIWSLRDQIADAVARDLGIQQRQAPTQHAGLETEEEQEIYVRALGALDRGTDEKGIDGAIAGLHELLETAPDSSLVHATLGRAYYSKYALTRDRQWTEKAVRACTRATALDPQSPDTLMTLGTVESLRGNYEESIAAFQRALALRPTSAMAAIGLAQTLSAEKRYAEAEQMFRRGIGLHPTWWFGHNELGSLFWHRGRYDDALREFGEVIRLDPQSSWGYTNSGAVLVTKGRLDDAVAMFKKATSLTDDAAAYVNLGYCYFFLGQYDKAVESIQTAVRLRGSFSAFWVDLGDACAWSSKYQKDAGPAYETAAERANAELAVNPKSPRAHATLAIALARTGDLPRARQSMRRAMALDPENPEHFFRAARIANLDGHSEEAVSWLKRALAAGSSRLELERHPEFAQLRRTEAVRELLNTRPQT